ncbi:MAG: S46 family peptidase [Planctomycetes bacterium]|nr:S46 family peptidase [Planctomycetota bacterium]
MKSIVFLCAALAALVTSASSAVALDEGMWLFNKPPAKELQERYGFTVTPEFLEHLQLSCVRFSTGGSGSFVSGSGLVMTNHHVGADMLAKLSTPVKDLLETGYVAHHLGQELACPDLELDCLYSIEDVTAKVNGAVTAEMNASDAQATRRAQINAIEKEAKEKTGLKPEVVTLFQGGQYHLYLYKNYKDVRLVFAPEKQAAFFGGDPDNFEFPRFNLDCTFFRVYEDGKPLQPRHWLKWSEAGVKENDLVFVAGHPGSTERAFTMAHLEFLRDVRLPFGLAGIFRSEVWLKTFSDRSEEWRRIAEDELFGIQNSRKALTGRLAGLQDPVLMKSKADAEAKLRAAVAANPEWQKQWGSAWDEIAAAETNYRAFYHRFAALGGTTLNLGSDLAGVAKNLVRAADEKVKPNGERLREYSDSSLESLEFQMFSPAPVYPDLEMHKLAMRLSSMAEVLGASDPAVVAALAGKSPRARAEELVRGTKLADVAERKRLHAGGKAALDASNDPLIGLVKALDAESRQLRKRYEDEVQSVERAAYAKIAAANFAVYGDSVYPDATFTLRLSYGKVAGYDEGGHHVDAFTQLGGMFERAKERDEAYPFGVPASWKRAKSKLDLTVPFDFVSTVDIIGGNSGSPTVDRNGAVVGLIFDGNIQSLVWDIAYDDVQGRAVSVDARAMLEVFRKVYSANELADELLRKSTPHS